MGKRIRAALAVVTMTLLLCAAGYADDYYRALPEAAEQLWGVESRMDDEGNWIIRPENADICETGFLFYPGGKVEEGAYLPLLSAIAREGYFCVIVKMPLHLAVLDMDAGSTVRKAYPQMKRWVIGGHSLGGAMAAAEAAAHPSEYAGLVLLAAYGTEDLTDADFPAVSIYGSSDGVLNREKLEAARSKMPPSFQEYVLEGGNHAGFGCYGPQKGDGEASITRQEQWNQTKEILLHEIFTYG